MITILKAKIDVVKTPPKKCTPGKNGRYKGQTTPKKPAPDAILEEV